MKKWILIPALLLLFCCVVRAETARDYALYLEEALLDANFADAAVPEFVIRNLGADYDFIARTDEQYGAYIAGVRKEDALKLPDDAHQSSFSGTFATRWFRAEDNAGNIYYDFALAENVDLHAYDGLEHLIVLIQPEGITPNAHILLAAEPMHRAQLFYAAEHGFSLLGNDQSSQMVFPVHSKKSWQAGATREPIHFHLDVALPENFLGERYLEEEDLIQYARIPLGIQLRENGRHYELVRSESGALGVETEDPHRLYEAGTGWDILLDLAEGVLGYRPGEMDFIGKTGIRAELQWEGGSIVLEDAKKLAKLDKLLAAADFTVGSVNCPSPCFLSVDYSDGSHADFAVAINSFDLFFHNGMYFTAGDGELLDIFGINTEEIYVQG